MNTKFYPYLILIIMLAISGCMKTVSLNTYRPAQINIPNNIQSITLVDRTQYEKDAIGIIEGVITGEGINQDKDGVLAMFQSLQNNLRNSPRFNITIATEKLKGQNILGSFPEPLDWGMVNFLNRKYNSDAVLVVEIFDSNFIITDGKRKNTRKVEDKNGNEIEEEYTEFFAEGVGSVRIGLRLYDPETRSIIDQEIFTQQNTWEAAGTSLKDAMAELIQRSRAVNYLAQTVGYNYASKIAPMPVRISRNYYHKPKKNAYLSKGARQASVNQWDEAINTWKSGMNKTSDTKALGRMAYNIAVGYEILGDLYAAHEWAGKSYVDYGLEKGISYAAQIDNRMINEEILNEQMSLPEDNRQQNNQEEEDSPKIKIKIDN